MIPKFRFWYEREDYYPDENYMRHVWGIEYISDSKIELNDDYIFNPYTNVAENIYAKTKIYLMQSTGLKDKNGVEIYEGDIISELSEQGENWENWEKHILAEVVRHKAGFYGKEKGHEPEYPITEFAKGEVIGNIYENPELLEVTE